MQYTILYNHHKSFSLVHFKKINKEKNSPEIRVCT